MKKIILTLAVTAFMISGYAQPNNNDKPDPEFEKVQEQVQAKIENAVQNMPEELKKKVQAAIQEAELAKHQIEQMIQAGKTPEEIEAMKKQAKEQAEKRLNEAIQNMHGASEQLKGQVEQVKEQIRKRIEEKAQELKQAQEQHQNGPDDK